MNRESDLSKAALEAQKSSVEANDISCDVKTCNRELYQRRAEGRHKDSVKNKRNKRRKPKKYQPQVGVFPVLPVISEDEEGLFDFSGNLLPDSDSIRNHLQAFTPDSLTADILMHIERFIALVVALKGQKKTSGVVATIVLYTQTYYDVSYVAVVKEFLCTYFSMEEQADYDWVESLKGLNTNWKMMIESASFKKVSALLSVCTTLGLVNHSKFQLSSKGLHGLAKANVPLHKAAVDIIDAVLGSVTHFFERGFMFFKTKDWKVFFYDNKETLEFDNEFFLLCKMHDYALVGDVESKFKVTENSYSDRLVKLSDKAKETFRTLQNGFEKKVYHERLAKLQKMETEFEMRRSHGGLREAPLGICVYGPSSVGKSTVVNIVNTALMKCFELGGSEHVITLNEIDKFESNMRSNVQSVILDDVANTSPQYVQNSPSERIIRYVNNIIQTANMAEADMKGKVQIRPKVVFATTNVKDLGASVFSNEPVSVVRRMSLIITVSVRDEYRLHGSDRNTQMLDPSKIPKTGELVQDLWLFNVERCVGVPSMKKGCREPDQIEYVPYMFEGKPTTDLDIFTLIRFVNTTFAEHQETQRKLVKTSNSLFETLDVCKICYNTKSKCSCMDKQALPDVTPECLIRARNLYDSGMCYWHSTYIRRCQLWRYFGVFQQRHEIMSNLRVPFITVGLSTVLLCLGLWCGYSSFWIVAWAYLVLALYHRVCSEFEDALTKCSALPNLGPIFQDYELDRARKVMLGTVSLGIIYQMCKLWRAARRYDAQGNLLPTDRADVEKRDKEESDWAKVKIEPLPVSHQANTVTDEQLQELAKANLCHVVTEGGSRLLAFFVKSNLALIPGHMLDPIPGAKEELIGTFTRYGDKYTRGTWKARLSRVFSYKLPNVDVRVVWIPNSPSFRDLTCYLSRDVVRGMPGMLIRKEEDGNVLSSRVKIAPNGENYDYDLDFNTFCGLCGAPLLGFSKSNILLGIHVAGITGTPKGRAAVVTQKDISDAERWLKLVPGYCPAASAGELKTELYEKQFFIGPVIHRKSPTNYLEKGTTVQVYGSCIGRSTANSSVVRTVISNSVAAITGVACTYGPPKFRGPNGKQPWHPWRESLNKSGQTTIGVEGKILTRAVQDYQNPLITLLHKQQWWKTEMHPLSPLENVSGIDGRKFINALDPSTSVGFPLSGPKSDYMSDLSVAEFPTHNCPRAIDNQFWEEAQRMETIYESGMRTYPIFKGCLKDEATKITKDKVRVFQASPIALQLLIRKYYLPVARFMSMNPLVTECAVGINAIGPEWDQLTKHIARFGKDNILAGDYSKYDLTMSPQLMFAAFSIMVRLAREAGYVEKDLYIMEMLATDICYPVVAYNGDLVELLGSNPSGQNLTVYINSIVNSLLFRAAYFTLVTSCPKPFRSVISLITYGDDAKSSVAEEVKDEIDHIKFAEFLDTIGMKFTMPDKNSVATAFMTDDEADLLKRKNVWMEELGHWVGALDEDSIFKSLHMVQKSKVLSPKEQAVQNIDTAVQDWFYHGREVYERRLGEIRRVAKENDLDMFCNNLDCSFEHWVVRWRNKYLGEDLPFPSPDRGWRD